MMRTAQKRPAWIEIQYCAGRPPERYIGAILDVRSHASSALDSSQLENHSIRHLYRPVVCSPLVIARLAGQNPNAWKKKSPAVWFGSSLFSHPYVRRKSPPKTATPDKIIRRPRQIPRLVSTNEL